MSQLQQNLSNYALLIDNECLPMITAKSAGSYSIEGFFSSWNFRQGGKEEGRDLKGKLENRKLEKISCHCQETLLTGTFPPFHSKCIADGKYFHKM